MKTFEVGTRVVLVEASNLDTYNVDEDDTTRGVVKSIDEAGKLLVKWDDSWRKPNPEKVLADALITEAEADQILSKLEEEYEVWAAPIRAKIEESAKLLKEAGKLADKQNQDLAELHDLVGPLISAMRSVGWRTSSLSC
jgi:hypothetical protein